ncbi:unnamed protein product [Schistocephalus solidus]|uniref:TAFH domain-containing protein n=1 Tax=Schistocephalus solidus TaxID=70667 RepID=A0A183SWB4_SCHSO|nr:unnamed protein product [Schistocephalus solidus]
MTRPPLGNQFYILHNGAVGPMPTPPPNVMQVRSLADRQIVTPQANGLTGIAPRPFSVVQSPLRSSTPTSGASQLAVFMNQLIELSRKSAPVGTQNAIVNLIQQLVDSEIDCDTFCTQLSASLNRDAEPMNIGPFIKDNIALLRRELYSGVCTLPNIRPPSLDAEISQSQQHPSSIPQPVIAGVSTVSNLANSVSTPVMISHTSLPVRPSFTNVSSMESAPSTILPRQAATTFTSHQQQQQHRLPSPAMPISITSQVHPSTATSVVLQANAPTTSMTYSTAAVCVSRAGETPIFTSSTSTLPSTAVGQPLIHTSNIFHPVIRPILPSSYTTRTPHSIAPYRPQLRPIAPTVIVPNTPFPVVPSPHVTSTAVATTTPMVQAIRMRPVSIASTAPTQQPTFTRATVFGSVTRPSIVPQSSSSTIATSSTMAATALQSPLNQPFFPVSQLKLHLAQRLNNSQVTISDEAYTCIAHGLENFLRSILTRLSIVMGHKALRLSNDPHLTQTDFARDQMAFLVKLDEHDKNRKSELEREMIFKAAKSRLRNEHPEQQRLRDIARQLANENYEREQRRQANLTALSAIGDPRKSKANLSNPDRSLVTTRISTLGTGGELTGSHISGLPQGSRLSLVNASQLRLLPTNVAASASCLGLANKPGTLSRVGSSGSGLAGRPISGSTGFAPSSSFNLAASLRARKAGLRDLQLVLSKDAKLCRSKTYFKSFWR